MDVGLQMVFASYGWTDVSDAEVWDEELELARLAADLGFDVLWSVEHHFNDYSFCPDIMEAAVWGTPDRILRKLEERRGLVGDFELATSFRFGGTPYDLAETGLRLYAKEVLPVVHSWRAAGRQP